jgi:hypothetical protein
MMCAWVLVVQVPERSGVIDGLSPLLLFACFAKLGEKRLLQGRGIRARMHQARLYSQDVLFKLLGEHSSDSRPATSGIKKVFADFHRKPSVGEGPFNLNPDTLGNRSTIREIA